jgi:hypothetical protein
VRLRVTHTGNATEPQTPESWWDWMRLGKARTPGVEMKTRRRPALLLVVTCLIALHLSATGAVGAPPERVEAGLLMQVAKPKVTNVSPRSGPTTGGTRVTITGKRFGGLTKVRFGKSKALDVTRISGKKVRVTAPAHAAGQVHIKVVTGHGRSKPVNADTFTYTEGGPAVLEAGSYGGRTAQNRAITLYVSAGGTHLQDISVPLTDLSCKPAGNGFNDKIQIASVAINPDGSFTSTTTQTGIISGHPTTFTYVFRGNVHGVNADGIPRMAGTLRETLAWTDTPGHECSTNDQSWYAEHT